MFWLVLSRKQRQFVGASWDESQTANERGSTCSRIRLLRYIYIFGTAGGLGRTIEMRWSNADMSLYTPCRKTP